MLVEGFDQMDMFITAYNFPYYVEHLEKLGFSKKIDWVENLICVPQKNDERFARIADYALKRNNLHAVEIKNIGTIIDKYGKDILNLTCEAYKNLYGVIQLSDEQINMYIKQFKSSVNPDFLSIVVDENDKTVAFGVIIPSLAEASKKAGGKLFPFGFIHLLKAQRAKKVERLEMLLVAVEPSLLNSGINAAFIAKMLPNAIKYGVKYAETGPMLETNFRIQNMWKSFDLKQHKRRRCFIKEI